ncbi:5-formyltetrahydrofolate cyclo-ligase isoform X2 [Anabrus simplex]
MTDKSTIMAQKAALRKQLNNILNSLTTDDITRQSDIVLEKVLKHPVYQAATSVSVYLSFDKEIQTDKLLQDIFKSGKKCYIPRFRKGVPDMEMVHLKSLDDYEQLPLNRWNIRQPRDDDKRRSVFDDGSLDVVLMPGLGFTRDGHRLGRGKGYYDGFLTRCFKRLSARPATLALAFQQQIVPSIPCTETDVRVDEVLFVEE